MSSSSVDFSDESSENYTTRGERRSNRNLNTPRTPRNADRRRKQKRPMSMQEKEVKFRREVNRLIQSKVPMIPRLRFSLLVREIIRETSDTVNRITETALQALQETCEIYVTQVLSDAYLLTLHCKRVTLMLRDLQVLAVLRGTR